ncbi:ATP-binding protein [Parabacteroides gordonii]|jgi:serine/threonine-protein kinase RsbW|uniref:ATP-binding protein n=1 Tax=Parabacteroides gordonii TaxID=574930 RepID=UPI00241D14AB|nr:ATP-binding protein [Parabacteroides gordonii]
MTSTLHIKNDPEQLALLYDFLEQQAGNCGFDAALLMQIKLAMDEAVTNVIQYAYPGSEGDIWIDMGCDNGQLKIVITDNGIQFNPLKKQEPDITLSLDERPIGGLGIFLVKQLMTDVRYDRSEGKNILTMTKEIQ